MVNKGLRDHDFSCAAATLRQVIKYIISKRLLYGWTGGENSNNCDKIPNLSVVILLQCSMLMSVHCTLAIRDMR